jgi:hypothetical protein
VRYISFSSRQALFHLSHSTSPLLVLVSSDILSWKDVEFCQRLFLIYWDDHVFLFLILFMSYVYQFAYVKSLLHPWNKTNLIMAYGLLNGLSNSICKWFIEIFLHLCSLRKFVIFFFCCVLIQFWHQSNTGFIERVWYHSFPLYFMESFEEH